MRTGPSGSLGLVHLYSAGSHQRRVHGPARPDPLRRRRLRMAGPGRMVREEPPAPRTRRGLRAVSVSNRGGAARRYVSWGTVDRGAKRAVEATSPLHFKAPQGRRLHARAAEVTSDTGARRRRPDLGTAGCGFQRERERERERGGEPRMRGLRADLSRPVDY